MDKYIASKRISKLSAHSFIDFIVFNTFPQTFVIPEFEVSLVSFLQNLLKGAL